MSDSGVWGITQEYFDKVYPQQEKRRKKLVRRESGKSPATQDSRLETGRKIDDPPCEPLLPNFP